MFALRALPLLLPVKQSVGKEKRFTVARLITNARNAFIVEISVSFFLQVFWLLILMRGFNI